MILSFFRTSRRKKFVFHATNPSDPSENFPISHPPRKSNRFLWNSSKIRLWLAQSCIYYIHVSVHVAVPFLVCFGLQTKYGSRYIYMYVCSDHLPWEQHRGAAKWHASACTVRTERPHCCFWRCCWVLTRICCVCKSAEILAKPGQQAGLPPMLKYSVKICPCCQASLAFSCFSQAYSPPWFWCLTLQVVLNTIW